MGAQLRVVPGDLAQLGDGFTVDGGGGIDLGPEGGGVGDGALQGQQEPVVFIAAVVTIEDTGPGRFAPIHVPSIRYNQVEVAVIVIIRPCRGPTHAGAVDQWNASDSGKDPSTFIMEQQIRQVMRPGDEEVQLAVVVIIPPCGTSVGPASGFPDIILHPFSKLTRTVVGIQAVHVGTDHNQIEVTVVVVVSGSDIDVITEVGGWPFCRNQSSCIIPVAHFRLGHQQVHVSIHVIIAELGEMRITISSQIRGWPAAHGTVTIVHIEVVYLCGRIGDEEVDKSIIVQVAPAG